MTRHERDTYLKRTQLLRRQWRTRVPKRKVNLDVVSFSPKTDLDTSTFDGMKACGSVGCIAGWAFAMNRDRMAKVQKINTFSSRLDACYKYYGVSGIWSSFIDSSGSRLFGSRHRLKMSQWREGLERLNEYIHYLKTLKVS